MAKDAVMAVAGGDAALAASEETLRNVGCGDDDDANDDDGGLVR